MSKSISKHQGMMIVARKKATKANSSLARMMPNIGRPKNSQRLLNGGGKILSAIRGSSPAMTML